MQCERCPTQSPTVNLITRSFGPERLCEPCAVNVRRDGQEVTATDLQGEGKARKELQ